MARKIARSIEDIATARVVKNESFSEAVVVFTVADSGTYETNKNGLLPLIARSLSGKIPSFKFIDGTVAEREGFEPGKKYLVNVVENSEYLDEDTNELRRDFVFQNNGEVTMMEYRELKKEFGAPVVVDVSNTVDAGKTPTTQNIGSAGLVEGSLEYLQAKLTEATTATEKKAIQKEIDALA